jgi:putative protease
MSLYDDKKLYSDKFTMSAKDMCLISKVEQLIKIGISSLKIEGRMKSEYYIATIVKAYRNAIDAIYRNEHNIDDYIKDAAKAANRSADIAWFDKNPNCHKMLYYEKQQTVTQNFAFVINKKINSNTYEITVKNNMKMSDKYELISKNFNKTINIKILQMKNKDMDSVTVFPTPQAIGTITFEKDIELQIGDIGRITSI